MKEQVNFIDCQKREPPKSILSGDGTSSTTKIRFVLDIYSSTIQWHKNNVIRDLIHSEPICNFNFIVQLTQNFKKKSLRCDFHEQIFSILDVVMESSNFRGYNFIWSDVGNRWNEISRTQIERREDAMEFIIPAVRSGA